MDFNSVYIAIKPLKNRIHLNNAIFCIMAGITAAGSLSLLLAFLSLFTPVPFLNRIILFILPAAFVLSVFISLFLRPANLKVMKVADSLGLKERLVTAYELKDDFSPISRIQRYDTLKSVSGTDFGALYPIRFPNRLGLACIALGMLIGISLVIPSESKDAAAGLEKLFNEIKKQAEKIGKEKKDLNRKASISAEKLKDINKKIDELLKELKKSKSEGEAVKSLSRAKHELEELKNTGSRDDLSRLAENLTTHPLTRNFGQALKSGDMSDMKQRLEKLNESLKNMDEQGRKELAEAFKKAAEEVSKNKQLAQNLHDLSNAMASGGLNSISSELSSLSNTLSQLAAGDRQLADAMQQFENQVVSQVMDSLDDARYQISRQGDGSAQAARGNAPGASGQQGNTPQEGNGQQGNSPNSGRGNNPGDGNGSNGQDNRGGDGAGSGSTNKDAGYGGEETGGKGRAPGSKTVKDYESVYVPERLHGSDGEQSQVNGLRNNTGISSWTEADNVPIEKGSPVPYDRVLGEYRDEAMSSLDSSTIPPVMKDIVRDYFTSLE